MNRPLSELIDYYALYRLHRKKSHEKHFIYPSKEPIALEEILSFYKSPEIPEVIFSSEEIAEDYRMGCFQYETQVTTEFQCNNHVIGRYYEKKASNSDVNVVMVHGWRSNGHHHLENIYLEGFKKQGYNLYFYTLPYHLERAPASSLYSGEYMVSANIDRTLNSIKQAVTDLRGLIKWIKANRGGKVILIGVSLGGYLTNLTSVLEKEIDALISVMYANSLAFSIWNSSPGKYIKKDLLQGGFTYEDLIAHWQIINPSNYQPLVKKENILLISGRFDQYVLMEDTNILWEKWNKPNRLVYPWGHGGIVLARKKIFQDSNSFLQSIIN